MTTYVVLIPGDDDAWEAKTPAEQSAVFATHAEFARLLEKRGHIIRLTYPLEPASTARTLRRTPTGVVATDGPYAESTEQVSGLYVVDSDDRDDLVECCRVIAAVETGVEVRTAGDPDPL
jgi:hypothetical protein